MSQIELVINPKTKDLGDNFVVRRSLPDIRKKIVGPFVFWDHMGPVTLTPETGMVVRSHPHIGLATITWLFSGEILHRDSLGNEQPIRPGEVNWMTAGSGIAHSERAEISEGEMNLEGIQLWLALPKEHEEVDANFFHCKANEIPKLKLQEIEMQLIAGSFEGEKSPVPVYSDLFYLTAHVKKGQNFDYTLPSNQEASIYIAKGNLNIEGDDYDSFHQVIFKPGAKISFNANQDSNIMIFGGEIFPEKRHLFWNFVSSSKERIEQAKKDWKEGKFPKTIKETDFIPLPE
jgi:redox-sensitive bicupin YhaK (pirin superfamily)